MSAVTHILRHKCRQWGWDFPAVRVCVCARQAFPAVNEKAADGERHETFSVTTHALTTWDHWGS